MMEFHIARSARERYRFSETLFSYSGNVVLDNMPACREFAHRMNQVRQVDKFPDQAVHAGQLYAMGLIDEASHVLMARYREQFDPQVMKAALDWFGAQVGTDNLDKMLLTFVEQFPGSSIIRGDHTPAEWLGGATGRMTHREIALEELLLLWMANRNEAFKSFAELFDDKTLAEKTVYKQVTEQLPEYFATRPLVPLPDAKPVSLFDLLRVPSLSSPVSLAEQLEIIRRLWRPLLGDALDRLLLMASEILREEELAIWAQFNPPGKGLAGGRQQNWKEIIATADVPVFGDPANEYERFSADTAWMPGAVLIAKSTYVWLAQLSKQYGRHIGRLDEIPDAELATLAHRGINSLWLIGIWERSRASKTIKQLTGNSDAVASAYSLFDYRIADDLGGEPAYIHLRDRAYHHGIRLASDMVPNHMGIDSPWVIEHPDWFMSRWESPYPAYSFNGPDLSSDSRVEIKIEDHYFEQTDAAVVFRRRDKWTGETRYIYHGNDGTSFPWNDTAQLDYLNPAVREHVIQTILHVARLFPVIRFDAAMTLAKRHFHRLWFPGPGSSGAIPSRAEYGMTQQDFDRAMPHEFWREVVDRVAQEVPGTLLLAEAFWLMEGYFVRTLGMHRVYNSAFMVMLRDEDNAKYRSVLKNTLEFDPDIMKRYVNFMSNPDERTTIDQFGKGDKCFGVAVMMSTLPGLPMFGHGQIEGYTEKYGMEYRWPRHDEWPDQSLVQRHEREIAPLLKRRWLFAESSNFLLYDFYTGSGAVDENVFAYSNRNGDERAVVIYNNKYGSTLGTIDSSAAYADKGSGQLKQQRLRDGLGLSGDPNVVLAFRDSLTGLEFLRRATDVLERGLTIGLNAYQSYVFLDWRELRPSAEEPWDRLCDILNGRGVPNLRDEIVNLELRPVHNALLALIDPEMVRDFASLAEHREVQNHGTERKVDREREHFFGEAWPRALEFLHQARSAYATRLERAGENVSEWNEFDEVHMAGSFRQLMRAAMRLPVLETVFTAPLTAEARQVLADSGSETATTVRWGAVLCWCVIDLLAESVNSQDRERVALDLFDRLRLRQPIAQVQNALGIEGEEAWRIAARIKVDLLSANLGKEEAAQIPVVKALATDPQERAPVGDFSVEEMAGEEPRTDALTEASSVESALDTFGLNPSLWSDPDVRWLCGVHEDKGWHYFVREQYEELLRWLAMPSLLDLAEDDRLDREAVQELRKDLDVAMAAAHEAGYRVEVLVGASGSQEMAETEAAASSFSAGQSTSNPVMNPVADEPSSAAEESPIEPF